MPLTALAKNDTLFTLLIIITPYCRLRDWWCRHDYAAKITPLLRHYHGIIYHAALHAGAPRHYAFHAIIIIDLCAAAPRFLWFDCCGFTRQRQRTYRLYLSLRQLIFIIIIIAARAIIQRHAWKPGLSPSPFHHFHHAAPLLYI